MENLTKKEIDTLIDALEAWETKDFGSELMLGLFGVMLCKDDPEAKVKMEIEENKRKEKLEMERRERKEMSLMLKAKLITIKQQLLLNDATNILDKEI